MTDIPCKLPAHSYVWGRTYEVRDPQNRVIIRLQVLKGDLQYRKDMDRMTNILADLLSGKAWVESGEEGYKLFYFGENNAPIEKPLDKPLEVPVKRAETPVISIKEDDDEGSIGGEKIPEVLEHQKRKPGRPKGLKNK